jgi:hypothetical protein
VPAAPHASEAHPAGFDFAPLTPDQRRQDWVTLLNCPTMVSADMVSSRLRAEGIATFIPDEFLMQAIAFNLNTFGHVRIQVPPRDYDAAKALLCESGLQA